MYKYAVQAIRGRLLADVFTSFVIKNSFFVTKQVRPHFNGLHKYLFCDIPVIYNLITFVIHFHCASCN